MGTSEIEAEHLDPKVHFVITNLHPHCELRAKIVIVRADIAANSHGEHVPHINETVFLPSSPLYQLGIEVFGNVFY